MCEVLLKSIQKSTRYLNCCDCVNCTTEFSFAWTKRQSTCFIVRLNQIEITSCDRSPRFYLWFVCEVLLKSIQKSTSKVLKLLWLRQLYNGVFIRLNKTTINMFHLVEPFVTYGYPNLKIIRGLFYKRGFWKINIQ